MNNGVDYTIISKPSSITFECPFCHEEVEVNFDEVDFNSGYWGDGAWCDCPECGEEVELDDYEYDQENNIMKGKYKGCDIEVERGDSEFLDLCSIR